MKVLKQLKSIHWIPVLLFYGFVLAGTYWVRKLPNLFQLLLGYFTDIRLPFNYNHGLVTLISALVFYKYSRVPQQISLLGTSTFKSLLFPLALLVCYAGYGMPNKYGIDRHWWALLFCSLALLYNIMEEYAWRGFLLDALGKIGFVFKSVVSGIFWALWHLLVFQSFSQYGGFAVFFACCIVFSFLLNFAVLRTRSILVAAAIHTFIIQINIVAWVCMALFLLLLLTWGKKGVRR